MFAFKKANEWGIADVDALLDSISSDQWSEWMVWERDHYPHVSEAKMNTALQCAVIANGNRDPKKKPFQVEDFLPKRFKAIKVQSPQELRDALSRIAPVHIVKGTDG